MTSSTEPDDDVRRRLTVAWSHHAHSRRQPHKHRLERPRLERTSPTGPALAAVFTTGLTLVLALLIGVSPLSARSTSVRPVAAGHQHRAHEVSRQVAGRGAAVPDKGAPVAAPLPRPVAGTHLMVDMASAPSLHTVRLWQRASPYRAIGVYVHVAAGADDRHDKVQRNLTPDWVGKVRAGGWRVLPIYLGAQAPAGCQHGGFHTVSSSPVAAQRQGVAAASDAARSTAALGLSDVPVMYDMEPYHAGCGAAVRAFFLGWTSRLHQLGRLSGIYGVPSSLVHDLLAATPAYPQPDVLWAATANGSASTAVRAVPSGRWSGRRANQFALDVARRYGGKRLHVDDSAVDDGVWTMTRAKGADTVAPALTVADSAAVVNGRKTMLRWSAVDEVSARVALQTQVRRTAGGGAPLSAWTAPAPTGQRLQLRLAQGAQECVRVRAVDAVGNASHWVRQCTARLIDDRRLHGPGHKHGWKRTRAHGALHGKVLTATKRHARLKLGATQRASLGVLLRGRGSVTVRVDGHRAGVLHAGGLRWTHVPAGRVTLVAHSAHVSVDGYVLTPR